MTKAGILNKLTQAEYREKHAAIAATQAGEFDEMLMKVKRVAS